MWKISANQISEISRACDYICIPTLKGHKRPSRKIEPPLWLQKNAQRFHWLKFQGSEERVHFFKGEEEHFCFLSQESFVIMVVSGRLEISSNIEKEIGSLESLSGKLLLRRLFIFHFFLR